MLHAAEHRTSSTRWRFWRKILIAFLALLVLIYVAAEIVLSTDIPRNLVVTLVEKQLGLRISAKSLSAGMFGHTTLNDVTVTLPLSNKAFLTVPTLKLEHTALPLALIGFSFDIHSITVDHPQLQVVQDPGGDWNLQEVLELLARTGGSNNAQQNNSKPDSIPLLPNLDVIEADVTVTDNQSRATTIHHLNVTGKSDGPLVWNYHATVPDQLDATGKIAPGGPWAHVVDLKIKNAQSWFAPWDSNWPDSAQLQAHLTGQVDSGNYVGRIDLQHVNFNSVSIAGPIDITSGAGAATLRPDGLSISDSDAPSLDTHLVGGSLVINSTGIQSENLGVEFAQGRASLDAKYAFTDKSATIHAAWRDLALPSSVVQSGDLLVNYSAPLGQARFNATLNSTGTVKPGNWDATLSVYGTGNTLKTLAFNLTAQKLRFTENGGKSVDLTGLTADVGAYSDGLLLRDFAVGHSHPVRGRGGYSIARHSSWLALDGRGWRLSELGPDTLNIDLNIWTTPDRIHLQELYFNCGPLAAYLDGDYVYSLPKPVSAHAYLSEIPPVTAGDYSQPFRGSLQSTIDLNGTINPPDLALTGSAVGNDVHIGQRPLGDLRLKLAGYYRDGLVSIGSNDIQLMGGDWNVNGQWPVHNSLLRIDNLSVRHLSLPLAADTDNIAGTLDGKFSIDIRSFSLTGINAQGSADIHNLVIGNPQRSAAAQYLTFNDIHIPSASLEYGLVDVHPISITRTVGDQTGHATLSVQTTVEQPQNLTVEIDAKSWPALAAGAPGDCLVSTNGKFDLDLATQSALGQLDFQADTTWGKSPLGQLQTAINLQRRQVEFNDIKIKTLDGSATGSGTLDLDKPFTSRLGLYWKNLNLAALKPLSESLASLSGTADGSLEVHPANTPRPLGPLAIDLNVKSNNIEARHFKIGDIHATAFLGPDRIVLNDSTQNPNQVALAGGYINFWGRVAKHDGDVYQSLLLIDLKNLNLDTVLPAGSKIAKTPGLLSGEFTIIGRPKTPALAVGSGTLTLDKSDLAGTGPIALLFNIMHLAHDPNKPTGSGQIEFNIQDEDIFITALRYFDKGSEVRVNGVIKDLFQLPDCPISMIAVGSAQPLSHIHIPGLADVNDALGAIQHGAFTVKITGYLNKPKTDPIPFGDITQDMKNLLFGDYQSGQEP